MKRRVTMSWSSGKDSAWALHAMRQEPDIEVVGLVTTINADAQRVAMHAVRRELLGLQADSAGVPLHVVPLPHPCSNAEYEAAMHRYFFEARKVGADAVVYGDLALDDVRAYRENLMADSGLDPLFPLWGLDTGRLARQMVEAGLRARITCVNPAQMPARFAGREFNDELLDELPPTVDACGENGEFHTFVTSGPMLQAHIDVVGGETVERDGFVFSDLKPARHL